MGNNSITLEPNELADLYTEVKNLWKIHLQKAGVKLPRLDIGNPTNRIITLLLLYKYQGQSVSKAEITQIVRKFNPNADDVQDGRHLGPQAGFNIASGRRGDNSGLKSGEYRLENLTDVYAEFNKKRRNFESATAWDELLQVFDYRCATCGSKEGKRHLINTSISRTVLHQGHMDPRKPLTIDNLIPQCENCNQAYQDKFVFDKNGRVRDININSRWWKDKYRVV